MFAQDAAHCCSSWELERASSSEQRLERTRTHCHVQFPNYYAPYKLCDFHTLFGPPFLDVGFLQSPYPLIQDEPTNFDHLLLSLPYTEHEYEDATCYNNLASADETSSKTSLSSSPASSSSPSVDGKQQRNYPCQRGGCSSAFTSDKDRARHEASHDGPAAAKFRCICGRKTLRRDNHTQHVHKCTRKRPRGSTYQCVMGHEFGSKTEYIAHLADRETGCGKARGRPRKTA